MKEWKYINIRFEMDRPFTETEANKLVEFAVSEARESLGKQASLMRWTAAFVPTIIKKEKDEDIKRLARYATSSTWKLIKELFRRCKSRAFRTSC